MTSGNYRPASARASLEDARVALERMMSAGPVASREIPMTMAARAAEAWNAVENMLRGMTRHTELTGQPLLAEARRQNALSLDDAHALVALNDWVERTRAPGSAAQMLTLPPTEAEREVATNALAVLERASVPVNAELQPGRADDAASVAEPVTMGADVPLFPPRSSSPPAAVHTSERASPNVPGNSAYEDTARTDKPRFIAVEPVVNASPRRATRPREIAIGVVLLVVVAIAGAWYFTHNRNGVSTSGATADGIASYTKGSTATARMELTNALKANPKDTLALIYLGRIAREQHDNAAARRYLEQALQVEPENALALREYGSALLANGQPELARRFYVHALKVNADDRIAQGFLGCALMRLQRSDEAKRWFDRAGAGDWNNCAITPSSK